MMLNKRTLIPLMLGLALLGGCVGTPKTFNTNYYVLTAGPGPAPQAQAQDPVLELSALSLPAYLERPQLVTRPAPQRLRIHEYDRWGDNLRHNLERVLADNLAQSLNRLQVLVVPHMLPSVDYRLVVEIHRFEQVEGRQVQLQAYWSLFQQGKDRPIAAAHTRLHRALEPGNNMENTVAAMSQLVADMAHEIAAPLMQRQSKP